MIYVQTFAENSIFLFETLSLHLHFLTNKSDCIIKSVSFIGKNIKRIDFKFAVREK